MYIGEGTKNHIQKNGDIYADDGFVEFIPCLGVSGKNSKIYYGKPVIMNIEDYNNMFGKNKNEI